MDESKVFNKENYNRVINELSFNASYDSYAALAEDCGFSKNIIYSWINKKTSPRLNLLCDFLDYLGYHLEVVKNG